MEENTTIEEWFEILDKEYDEVSKEDIQSELQDSNNELQSDNDVVHDVSNENTEASVKASASQQYDYQYQIQIVDYMDKQDKLLTDMQATQLYMLVALGLIFGGVCALIFSHFWRD